MVSFFRKKKKSAEAKKDGKDDAKTQQGLTPPPSSRAVDTTSKADVAPGPAGEPGTAVNAGKQQQNAVGNKRSASFPSKRRNFMPGGLRGSRSSVSRLPAVQEELANPAAARTTVVTPEQHDGDNEEDAMMITESTPPTVPVSTPDLLGSLSFDDQQEGQVEILTPSAKDTIKKQLKFDSPDRGSRVASMEVSPDGVVSQISQDEELDILLETKEPTLDKYTQSVATASTATSSQLPHADSFSAGSQIQTPPSSPPRSSLAPKPKSSPVFVKTASQDQAVNEEEEEERNNRDPLGARGEVDSSEIDQIESRTAGTSQATSNRPPASAGSETERTPQPASAVSASYDDTPMETEESGAVNLSLPSEQPLPPTRTISLEQNRLNLVSPLTLHPGGNKEVQRHGVVQGAQSLEDDIEEEEDTLEETAEDTFTGTAAEHTETTSRNDWTKNEDETSVLHQVTKKVQGLAESLMDTLQCTPEQLRHLSKDPVGGAVSMFYDGVCKPEEDVEENPRRPYFNEEFAQRFVNRMLTNGMSLLYLQPPNTTSNPSKDWKGRTVVMRIVSGTTGSQDAIQPKLQWKTMAGGTTTKSFMTSISLLRIHSVITATQNLVPQDSTTADLDDDDLCFVSITSMTGKVFLFEANSVRERDEIANGLRNIVARLSFHLVAGDHTASTELYNDDRAAQEEPEPGDLPALANPKLNMNRMTHLLLEA